MAVRWMRKFNQEDYRQEPTISRQNEKTKSFYKVSPEFGRNLENLFHFENNPTFKYFWARKLVVTETSSLRSHSWMPPHQDTSWPLWTSTIFKLFLIIFDHIDHPAFIENNEMWICVYQNGNYIVKKYDFA